VHHHCYYGDVGRIVVQEDMQHSAVAANEEDMGPRRGGQIIRQYCNKRIRIKETEICTSAQGMTKEENRSSIFTSSIQVEDPHPAVASELKLLSDSKLSTSQPQVIVRKFTLPPYSRSYSLPVGPKRNTDFGKPKQRWKQLCNLQHEMTTTLGVSRVKMRGPSTPLTQEYRPGTLQSFAGTLDIMNSTLQKLLTSKDVDGDSPTERKEMNSVPCESIPMRSSDDTVDFKFDNVDVDEILDTAEEVPEIAEVSSTGGTVKFGPFDTAYNNIGIVGGKFVIFQPFTGTKQIIQQESGNSKVNTLVLKNPQGTAAEAVSGKRFVNSYMGQKEVTRSLLKTNITQGNVKPCSELASKESGVEQKILKHCFETVRKEQNVVWGSVKNNSPSVIKEQNVIWANQKHNSEPNMKQQIIIRGDKTHGSEVFKNEQNVKLGNLKIDTEPGSKIERNVKLGNLKIDTEPGSKIEQNKKLGNLKSDADPASKKQKGTDENLKHRNEPSNKDQNVSLGNLKTTSETPKSVTIHPVPEGSNCLKVAHDCLQSVYTKSAQTAAVVATGQSSAQSKNCQPIRPSHKPTEDANAEWKGLGQLHLEIMKMKRRRDIAMKVERDVLRAKDIKLVQEVLLPARKVLLSEIGTQTNLFSLVEPGRMVEMKISTDKAGKYSLSYAVSV
jgi:hypothetical protein